MTFRLVTDEGDPEHAEARRKVKEMLQNAMDRVDEDNIVTLALVGVSADNSGFSGRYIKQGAYTAVGLLEYEKMVVLGMIDEQLAIDSEGG